MDELILTSSPEVQQNVARILERIDLETEDFVSLYIDVVDALETARKQLSENDFYTILLSLNNESLKAGTPIFKHEMSFSYDEGFGIDAGTDTVHTEDGSIPGTIPGWPAFLQNWLVHAASELESAKYAVTQNGQELQDLQDLLDAPEPFADAETFAPPDFAGWRDYWASVVNTESWKAFEGSITDFSDSQRHTWIEQNYASAPNEKTWEVVVRQTYGPMQKKYEAYQQAPITVDIPPTGWGAIFNTSEWSKFEEFIERQEHTRDWYPHIKAALGKPIQRSQESTLKNGYKRLDVAYATYKRFAAEQPRRPSTQQPTAPKPLLRKPLPSTPSARRSTPSKPEESPLDQVKGFLIITSGNDSSSWEFATAQGLADAIKADGLLSAGLRGTAVEGELLTALSDKPVTEPGVSGFAKITYSYDPSARHLMMTCALSTDKLREANTKVLKDVGSSMWKSGECHYVQFGNKGVLLGPNRQFFLTSPIARVVRLGALNKHRKVSSTFPAASEGEIGKIIRESRKIGEAFYRVFPPSNARNDTDALKTFIETNTKKDVKIVS